MLIPTLHISLDSQSTVRLQNVMFSLYSEFNYYNLGHGTTQRTQHSIITYGDMTFGVLLVCTC